MEFGVFHLLQQRDGAKPVASVINEAVEHIVYADQLGYKAAWVPEHHFNNYSLCPSPLLMCGHLAAKTKNIRLGPGVCVAPLYQPARLLGEIGFVDHLSNGRLEIGIGPGYQTYEFERFGMNLAEATERTAEIWDIIRKGLTQPSFEHNGKFYQFPTSAIASRPLQQPLPPMAYAGHNEDMIRRAISEDAYIMTSFLLGGLTRMKNTKAKLDALAIEAGKEPHQVKQAIARLAFVTKNKADAEEFADNARYMQRLAFALKNRREKVENNYIVKEEAYAEELPMEAILANLPCGDVEHCIKIMVRDIKALGPSRIMLQMQMGGMDHKKSMASLELWADEVIPGVERELGVKLSDYVPQAEAA